MSACGTKHVLVYDVERKAPACVLLQSAFGCGDSNGILSRYFSSEHWLVAPTDGMRRIAGTEDEWRRAAEITRKTWGDRDPNHAAPASPDGAGQ